MTYTSTELSKLTGIENNQISKILRRLGYSPLASGDHNCHIWQEECLEILLQKQNEIVEDNKTILLTSLASSFNITVPEARAILDSKGIVPIETNNAVISGNKYERYPIESREILIRYFDDLKVADEDEHPLVINKAFLRTSFFPDVTPKCFEDLDKEVIGL